MYVLADSLNSILLICFVDTSDGEIEDPAAQKKSSSYDVTKLIGFPGFNTPLLPGFNDVSFFLSILLINYQFF